MCIVDQRPFLSGTEQSLLTCERFTRAMTEGQWAETVNLMLVRSAIISYDGMSDERSRPARMVQPQAAGS
jgi:hypothetical protein